MTLDMFGAGRRRKKHKPKPTNSNQQIIQSPPAYPPRPPSYPTQPPSKSAVQLRSNTGQYLDTNQSSCQILNQGAALCDVVASKLDALITSIDEGFTGSENEHFVYDTERYPSQATLSPDTARRGHSPIPIYPSSDARKGSNYFSKVHSYANSRLPLYLPPFKVYLPTWPLLCLAATHSLHVYSNPTSSSPSSHETHIPSNWRSGTKATTLTSLPLDSMHTIIFSIRGSATFMDWAVNSKSEPASPQGFLDDDGNLCHGGFLDVARRMVEPVAKRLRIFLQENPGRKDASLLITGHSAGGAVAALLYAHMLSQNVQSELTYLTGFFKRVHCVTFGAPPISLLPLQRPDEKRHRKSLFFSFVNEGDPVPRADKAVVKSLLRLYATPAPSVGSSGSGSGHFYTQTLASLSRLNLSGSSTTLQTASSRPSKQSTAMSTSPPPIWHVPPTTLSVPGRIIVLREKPHRLQQHRHRGLFHSHSHSPSQSQQQQSLHENEDIEAVTIDDQLLRTVVYGDPLRHAMSLYKRRIEILATKAVTMRG